MIFGSYPPDFGKLPWPLLRWGFRENLQGRVIFRTNRESMNVEGKRHFCGITTRRPCRQLSASPTRTTSIPAINTSKGHPSTGASAMLVQQDTRAGESAAARPQEIAKTGDLSTFHVLSHTQPVIRSLQRQMDVLASGAREHLRVHIAGVQPGMHTRHVFAHQAFQPTKFTRLL